MKNILVLLVALFLSSNGYCQESIGHLMEQAFDDCETIAFDCTKLIERYYYENKPDSIKEVLNFWKDRCGICEPNYRFGLLFAIYKNTFSDSVYDSLILDYMVQYKDRMLIPEPSYSRLYHDKYYGYVRLSQGFDEFTVKLATELNASQTPNSVEFILTLFYSNHFEKAFEILRHRENQRESKLETLYQEKVKNYKALSDYHASLFSGIWVPNGNARLLGSHPLIGFQVGRKINTIYYNIGMNLKFLNSRNDFIVNYNDQLYETQFFIGVYLGVDVMKEILNYRQYRINICGGAGWEGVEVFDKTFYTAYENVEQKVIHSLNLNMGLNWQLYFRNQNYIGLQMKFHYLNYSNPGGTDLSGNSITISFVFGGFMNYEKYMGLLDLGYY